MAMPPALLQQLLALDESDRIELAEALLDSVDFWLDNPDMPIDERRELNAVSNLSIKESDAGLGIPVEEAMSRLRAKRAAR